MWDATIVSIISGGRCEGLLDKFAVFVFINHLCDAYFFNERCVNKKDLRKH